MNSILLVNKNTEDLVTLSSLLARKGYCVIVKSDGASALSVIREGVPIDVVVADYWLPDMDGPTFFTSLKRTTAASPPVILVSDKVDISAYLRALSLGAFEFLFMPVHPAEFLRIVNVAIKRRAGHKDATVDPSESHTLHCNTYYGASASL